jgi:hypothetical protein
MSIHSIEQTKLIIIIEGVCFIKNERKVKKKVRKKYATTFYFKKKELFSNIHSFHLLYIYIFKKKKGTLIIQLIKPFNFEKKRIN